MRIQLVVAYDGTDFSGWAANPGQRTVQSTLTEAVRQVSNEEIEIVGASRTDSGAHARGQVCHFDGLGQIPSDRWMRILNRVLPPDLKVRRSKSVPATFHSRFSAQDRHYRYRIMTGWPDPHRSRYAYDFCRGVDQAKMACAAEALVGEHDFLAFTEELEPTVENTVRRLHKVAVKQVGDEMWVDVVGTAFLRGMMRRMSGALLEVGRGHRDVEEVSMLLNPEQRDRLQWPVVLPARGLCLMRVRYGRHPKDHRTTS